MSELVAIEYVSLDGVVQAPGHADEDRDDGFAHGGWTGPWIEEHGPAMLATFRAAGGIVLGRRTYDIWASYWPTASDELAVPLRAGRRPGAGLPARRVPDHRTRARDHDP